MEFIIFTNNSLVYDKYKDEYTIKFKEQPTIDMLTNIRDYIHKGHKLLTHPLSSSVKPNETPYKSVILSARSEKLDLDSLLIIENSILTYDKFNKIKLKTNYSDNVLNDFKLIDLTVLESAFK